MNTIYRLTGLLVTLLFISANVSAAVPQLVNYQGRLTDASGTPWDTTTAMSFTIYRDSMSTITLWSETQSAVVVSNGLFHVLLGSTTPIPANVFDGAIVWLGMQIGDGPQKSKPLPLVSVSYAYHAGFADTAAVALNSSGSTWSAAGNDIYYDQGKVGIGTRNPKETLQIGNWITLHDGGMKHLGFNWYWDGQSNRRISSGGAARIGFWPDGSLLFNTAAQGDSNSIISAAKPIYLGANGNVGIGTDQPDATLDVSGAVNIGGNLISARLGSGFDHWTYFGDGNSGRIRGSAEGYLYLSSNPNGIGDKRLYLEAPGSSVVIPSSKLGIGTIDPSSSLDVRGTTTTRILAITGGSDVAEPFPITGNVDIPLGSVVVIDAGNPGHLKVSAHSYDCAVAGIISGAGDVKPGITLRQEGILEGGRLVALSGKVYALATACNGSIQPGDQLTTSNVPGHVMKVTDIEKANGAVVGKAMTALSDGDGLVLVLVNLQ